jgi:gamma-glutamyl hercynylcysteine S-oxide synthase
MTLLKNLFTQAALTLILVPAVNGQYIRGIKLSADSGLIVKGVQLSDSSELTFTQARPFLSFISGNKLFSTSGYQVTSVNGRYSLTTSNKLKITLSPGISVSGEWSGTVDFENNSPDTLSVSNVVPFGENRSSVYITGYGQDELARASLFRPGFRPVRVILPDNAWEMGYQSLGTNKALSVCALMRRQKTEGGQRRRYETILPPGTKVTYNLNTGIFKGEWQNGLRIMFRDRYLYDLTRFDNALFERPDLAWIKSSYLIVLEMAWDKDFYDRLAGKYNYADALKKWIDQFGKLDVFGIWPTWPRLGLDQRNQWDLYRDLPGGTSQLKTFSRLSRPYGTRFFISYNPWDNSTRKEDQYKGMAKLILETEADGVVLDTRGSSSYELQAAADSVRKGVVMYSEGMAVTKDMPGIISGRVHNAIFYSPELNLNKLIKPDFSIFRVCDVGEDVLHREIAISFFNGYGTELNMFRPGGRGQSFDNDLDFLAKTTFILRQNNDAFLDHEWTPLIETSVDNAYVNRWSSGEKTIYTVLNMNPGGISGRLFYISDNGQKHYVSLWNHEVIIPEISNGKNYLISNAGGWAVTDAGTRKEGSVDCIGEFPAILNSRLTGDSVVFCSKGGAIVRIWKGNPSVKGIFREFNVRKDTLIKVRDLFGYYEGKLVLQLLENKLLKDEDVLTVKGGKPWLVSRIEPTKRVTSVPVEMVMIPGRTFSYELTTREDFIPYPEVSGRMMQVDTFLIDKFPVTNAQYYDFIVATGYIPSDTTHYLRHWEAGSYKQGQEKYPVVWLSLEDMKAYARWAQKRLPTEAEWQLAAQGPDKRKWPWGDEFYGTNCNNAFDRPTPVDAFLKGGSPYGVMDLVGNVWQMTGDLYFNGSNYFSVIRGGSYYKPDSSWWYIEGGPQELGRTQIMLLVSPGYDRSATVGFRCVKDIDPKNFKAKK